MHHFFEAITNTAGDSLIGYFARVINRTTQNTVTLSSDENGTPIVVVSGVENMAKTDDYGNLSLYVDPGTYHLDVYAPNTTTFLYRVSDVAMNSTKGDPGPRGDQGEPGEGLEDVMAPTGAALVGFEGRTVNDKLQETISVTDKKFAGGAKGDGATDDTAAIQAAMTFLNGRGGGTVYFPAGTYKVTASITLPDRVTIEGVGGHVGSLVAGTHAGPIFLATSDTPNNIREYTTVRKMAFTGAGCTAIGQSTNVDYLSRLMVTDCHFYGQLAYCIDGDLIFAIIEKNSFGYYGSASVLHRHIRSRGKTSNVSNNNNLLFNRFYSSLGGPSVEWENGSDLELYRNNWEQNRSLPLSLKGVPSTSICRNFFEGNQNTTMEILVGAGSDLVDSSHLSIFGNTFVPYSSITRLVQLDVAITSWSFDYNTGTSLAGKQVSNITTNLKSSLNNLFPGLTLPSRLLQESGTWNAVDAGGAVAITGTGTWERNGNHVDAEIGFTFPTNTNNGNNVVGGLPYPCSAIAVGTVLSNYAGGMDMATNGSTNSVTFFAPGTITPLTNAQLSGKTIYFTVRYPAS